MAFVKAKTEMRPSILLSALIYTQLRLKIKKNTPTTIKRPRTVILHQYREGTEPFCLHTTVTTYRKRLPRIHLGTPTVVCTFHARSPSKPFHPDSKPTRR